MLQRNPEQASAPEQAQLFIERVDALAEAVGIPMSLDDVQQKRLCIHCQGCPGRSAVFLCGSKGHAQTRRYQDFAVGLQRKTEP